MGKLFSQIKRNIGRIEKNTLLIVTEGALSAIVVNLATPFYQMFAKRMGAGDYALSMINALPALIAMCVIIPGSLMVDKSSNKKKVVSLLILGQALVLPLIALTPFAGPYKVPLFILGISVLNIPFFLYTISWQSLFSDIFSPHQRNIPYATRIMASTFLQTFCIFAGGLLLSIIPKTDAGRIVVYQCYYIIATLVALVQMRALIALEMPKSEEVKVCQVPIRQAFSECFKTLKNHKKFRSYIVLIFLMHFAWYFSSSLFFIYQFDYLHLNEGMKGLFDGANTIAVAVTCGFWGRQIEKKGAGFVIIFGMLGLVISPIWMVASTSIISGFLSYLFSGLTFPAFQLGIFQEMLRIVPEENKTLNIGMYNMVINLAIFSAPILGVALYRMTTIHFAMTFTSLVRAICLILLITRHISAKKKESTLLNS